LWQTYHTPGYHSKRTRQSRRISRNSNLQLTSCNVDISLKRFHWFQLSLVCTCTTNAGRHQFARSIYLLDGVILGIHTVFDITRGGSDTAEQAVANSSKTTSVRSIIGRIQINPLTVTWEEGSKISPGHLCHHKSGTTKDKRMRSGDFSCIIFILVLHNMAGLQIVVFNGSKYPPQIQDGVLNF